MRNREKNRTSAKYKRILEVSKELFFKHGVKRVTVEEICEKADVSKMTFYKYFTDKMQLATSIRDDLLEQGFSKYEEINGVDISYPEKIDLITQWRIDFFSNMTSEFIEEMLDIEDTIQKMKILYLKNINNAQEKGEIKKDISPELIWLVTEKLNELVKDGSWKSIFTDYKQFQRQLRTLYFYGLLDNSSKNR